MQGELSDYENNEDIDHAIALSLAEEEERQREKDQKGKHVIGKLYIPNYGSFVA